MKVTGFSTGCDVTTNTVSKRDPAFLSAAALLFVASAVGTVYWCGSMSGGMAMPGGWTMSMAWMRMPGQTWAVAAACFLGMWVVMMLAMMMPALTLMLQRYRHELSAALSDTSSATLSKDDENRLGGLTALASAGYFFAWAILGLAVYPFGVAIATAEMRWPVLARSVPVATGLLVLIAGGIQLTRWKSRQLGCCLKMPGGTLPATRNYRSAWRQGVRLGVHCILCCSGFMLVLLVAGAMNVGVMAMITVAMTLERIGPRPQIVARVFGVAMAFAGVLVTARALSKL